MRRRFATVVTLLVLLAFASSSAMAAERYDYPNGTNNLKEHNKALRVIYDRVDTAFERDQIRRNQITRLNRENKAQEQRLDELEERVENLASDPPAEDSPGGDSGTSHQLAYDCAPGGTTGGRAAHGAENLDPVQHRSLDKLWDFTNWLEENDACGYVGEVGWPNYRHDKVASDEEQEAWNTVAELWYDEADEHNVWVTAFNADEKQRYGGYWLSLYRNAGKDRIRAISETMPNSPPVEAHLGTDEYERGMNLSSGQHWVSNARAEKTGDPANTNTNPGTLDEDYWYPGVDEDPDTGQNSYEYLSGRDVDLFRVHFKWERMQPELDGPLSKDDVEYLRRSLDNAEKAGVKVILSVQSGGGYHVQDPDNPERSVALNIGDEITTAQYLDLMRRVSEEFGDHPAVVGYDLMNEPTVGKGKFDSEWRNWENITQRAKRTIRATGDEDSYLIVDTYGNLQDEHTNTWIDDPRILYNMHQYFDDAGGHFDRHYDEELERATRQGWG